MRSGRSCRGGEPVDEGAPVEACARSRANMTDSITGLAFLTSRRHGSARTRCEDKPSQTATGAGPTRVIVARCMDRRPGPLDKACRRRTRATGIRKSGRTAVRCHARLRRHPCCRCRGPCTSQRLGTGPPRPRNRGPDTCSSRCKRARSRSGHTSRPLPHSRRRLGGRSWQGQRGESYLGEIRESAWRPCFVWFFLVV
jgi:hypothetical protein